MTSELTPEILTPTALLEHWQGHRRLTRRTIAAFPDDKLFQFSAGGMRSFGELGCELLGMALPSVRGLVRGTWDSYAAPSPANKEEFLAEWDRQTKQLDDEFPAIPKERFIQTSRAFGLWEMTGIGLLQYVIDNEVHHRGQGYVYLRVLGITPPPFWERD